MSTSPDNNRNRNRHRAAGLAAWLSGIALLAFCGSALPAAEITTQGCADANVSCTLQELLDGGSIRAGNILFSNFRAETAFGSGLIEVAPVYPYFGERVALTMVPVDPNHNPWTIVNPPDSLYTAALTYDVAVLAGDPLGTAVLQTDFGELTGEFTEGLSLLDIAFQEIAIVCDGPPCSNSSYYAYGTFAPEFSWSGVRQIVSLETPAQGGAAEITYIAHEFVRVPSDERRIISSSLWRTSDTFVEGWEQVDFDDSLWAEARSPYPGTTAPTDLISGTTAQSIWHDPFRTSDGTTGPIHAYLRHTFKLDMADLDAPPQAIAQIAVDDDYDLYVNGNLVWENHDDGFPDLVDSVDIGPYLRQGDNVIAIHAVDGGWDNPRDRTYERVLFDAFVTARPYVQIPILSNSAWRSSDVAEPDWQTVGFDDSDWAPARAPYPGASASTLMPDTAALPIWHDPDGIYDGDNGPEQAYFRYEFDLPADPETLPVVGQMRVSVDDDYVLYVNGVVVHKNQDDGFADVVDFIDFTFALREGPNVIAVHAVDGGWFDPRPRGFERLLVDGLVASGNLDWNYEIVAQGLSLPSCLVTAMDEDQMVLVSYCDDGWSSPYVDTAFGVSLIDLEAGTSTVIASEGMPVPPDSSWLGPALFSWSMGGGAANGAAAIDDGDVVFKASRRGIDDGLDGHGLYFKGDGPIQTIDDTYFSPFRTLESIVDASVSDGLVAYLGDWSGDHFISVVDPGTSSLDIIGVGWPIPVPEGMPPWSLGEFWWLSTPSLDRRTVAFEGGNSGHSGIYLYDMATKSFDIVADRLTQSPGSDEYFEAFGRPSHADGHVAFQAWTPGAQGIYIESDGVLRAVHRQPGITNFCCLTTRAGRTAFAAWADVVFTDIGLGLTEVVNGDDLNPLPDLFDDPTHALSDLVMPADSGLARNRIAFEAFIRGEYNGVYDESYYLIVADGPFAFVSDADGDGVIDHLDNCTVDANGAQSDTDSDGYGNVCDPDLNNDGSVNFLDLQIMKDALFGDNEDADLNQDGTVNFADMAIVNAFFFGPPGPSALAD